MANLPQGRDKLNDQEISEVSPVSESLMWKLGFVQNDYLAKGWKYDFYDVAGNYEWVNPKPDFIKWVCVFGVGGGGGGGAAGPVAAALVDNTRGGGGGAGADLEFAAIPVGASLDLTVGVGGAGGVAGYSGGGYIGQSGSNGADSIIAGPGLGEVRFYGALGGRGGWLDYGGPITSVFQNAGRGGGWLETFKRPMILGGNGGGWINESLTPSVSGNGTVGSTSIRGLDGLGGAIGTGALGDRGTGGGGGGGSWGNGGKGGNENFGNSPAEQIAKNGGNGSRGAGGGGGGGSFVYEYGPAGNGGKGGDGVICVAYWWDQ